MNDFKLQGTALLLWLLLAARGAIFAQSVDHSKAAQFRPSGAAQSRRLQSWPSDAKQFLARHGVSLQAVSVNDLSRAPVGSEQDNGWFGRYSLDLSAAIDSGEALGWRGGRALVHLKQHLREFGTGDEDVAQGYSNIDGESRTTLYELWAQQTILDGRLRMKAGKIDANTEFAVVATAADFLNSSMGYSPTIMQLPTYPEPKAGAVSWLGIASRYQIGIGVFKAADRGRISMAEGSKNWTLGKSELAGRASLGSWLLETPLSRFDGEQTSGTHGYYGVVEQALWRRRASQGGKENQLALFLQMGTGDGHENPYTRHLGGGVVMDAPIPARPGDTAGISVSRVHFSDDPDCGFGNKAELAVETYYKITLVGSLSLVPDLQYFRNPDGSSDNYVVFTPRIVIAF